ncbi:MAG: butyrate kinase, partial [Gracilibacteraceae bacterium]|nr:butyrate kinase [Gracilibacteraceae bacterium]
MKNTILVLNTGSTSTKLAVYSGLTKEIQAEYVHDKQFLSAYPYVADQLPMRRALAEEFTGAKAAPFAPFAAIVARGGILPPIKSGGYVINAAMTDYLLNVCQEEHASNLAACIA